MAYDGKRTRHLDPLVWIIAALATAFGAGYSYHANILICILLTICALSCAYMILSSISCIRKRMKYVMEATLSGDFSYKFPTDNVDNDERDSNEMLNRIVEHLEHLTLEARQNEVFLARVIDLTDIGLVLTEANGFVKLHNEAALRLLDRQALTHLCQIPRHDYAELLIKKSDVIVNEKSFTLFTITDLSRQMQAKEVESWEKLTRILTHEIMNSLTPIQSIAETMSGKAPTRDMADALQTISSSSGSLMHFVRNFREFSILPTPSMRAFYLKPLLQSCVRISESYAKGMNMKIEMTCFPPELMVYSDEALLSRVLINILKNAIEAQPSNIMIEADEKADESVEIRILNDGELISEENAKHIFTPFFTTRTAGSGIGLSLSRRIITHLGGTLSLKTRPTTCFSVRI